MRNSLGTIRIYLASGALACAFLMPTPVAADSFQAPRVTTISDLYTNWATIVPAQFKGDGRPDLAAITHLDESVRVMFGRGDGTFEPPREYPLPNRPQALVAVDLRGTGKQDLVVADGEQVSVFLNNGDGSFGDPRHYQTPGAIQHHQLLAGDFRGTGHADVAAVSQVTSTLYLLPGTGDGSLGSAIETDLFTAGGSPVVVAADFRHIGRLDLTAVSVHSDHISVFRSRGDGSFEAPQRYRMPEVGLMVASGDLQARSESDLVVVLRDRRLAVLLGHGDGSFSEPVVTALPALPDQMAVAKVRGQGPDDVVLALEPGLQLQVYPSNGDGSFGTPISSRLNYPTNSMAVVHFRPEGPLDVAITPILESEVAVYLGVGDGTFQTTRGFATGTEPVAIRTADLRGVGTNDLIMGNDGSHDISVSLGNGDGTFQAPTSYPLGQGRLVDASQVRLADLRGNGRIDIVAATSGSSPGLVVLLGRGDGFFDPPRFYSTPNANFALTLGDFRGTGHLDIATAEGYGGVVVMSNAGDGSFSLAQRVSVPAWSVVAGDFRGTGLQDLATAAYNPNQVDVLFNSGDGQFRPGTHLDLPDDGAKGLAAADLTGSGRLDLVVLAQWRDDALVLLSNGDGSFRIGSRYRVGVRPVVLELVSLRDPHRVDLVVGSWNSGTVSVLYGNGDGTFQAPTHYGSGSGTNAVAVADLHGDGVMDIVAVNSRLSNGSILEPA